MAINLENFVQIKITKRVETPSTFSSRRDTTVLYYNSSLDTAIANIVGTGNSEAVISSEPAGNTDPYIATYFDNGGVKLHLIDAVSAVNVNDLDRDEIVLAHTESVSTGNITGWGTLVEGAKEKIFVEGSTSTDVSGLTVGEGIVYKYVGSDGSAYPLVMTVLAYYSKIKVYGTSACADYAFTTESVDNAYIPGDSEIDECIENGNINVEALLASRTRNLGGDDSVGNDLTNLYFRIVLTQFLQDRLITALANKIKYNAAGVAVINNVIGGELSNFVANGYISSDKTWGESDLYIDDELIVAEGETLSNGYVVHISPLSSLSDEDKAKHKFPDIYILYADSYSIRKIEITGEVY